MTLADEFEAWCEGEGVTLLKSQREAARMMLDHLPMALMGRASGKTMLFTLLDEFLDSRPITAEAIAT